MISSLKKAALGRASIYRNYRYYHKSFMAVCQVLFDRVSLLFDRALLTPGHPNLLQKYFRPGVFAL
jgi:hypothetical protein